jgi:hypothetical protein
LGNRRPFTTAPVHCTEYQTEREHNAFNANRWQFPIGARAEAAATVPRISVKGNIMDPSSPRSSANISTDGPSRYLLRCSMSVRVGNEPIRDGGVEPTIWPVMKLRPAGRDSSGPKVSTFRSPGELVLLRALYHIRGTSMGYRLVSIAVTQVFVLAGLLALSPCGLALAQDASTTAGIAAYAGAPRTGPTD